MFENSYYRLGLDGGLRYELKGGGSLPLAYPRFQIEGEDSGAPAGMELTGREDLPDGRVRLRCQGTYPCGASLQLEALVHPETCLLYTSDVYKRQAAAHVLFDYGDHQ